MFILIGGKARAGKDTSARYFNKFLNGGEIYSLAYPIKNIIPQGDKTKNKIRPEWIKFGKKMRSIDKDYFVNCLKSRVFDLMELKDYKFSNLYILIPDIRYQNELDRFNESFKTFSVYIDASDETIFSRIGKEEIENHKENTMKSESENSIDKESFDVVITNNGSKENLEKKIKKIVKTFR